MWKLSANYHFPIVYPDWGFGNILYFHLLLRNFDEEVFGLKMSSHPLFQQIKTISEFLFSSFNQYGDYVSSDFFVKKLRIDNKTKDEFDSLKSSLSFLSEKIHLGSVVG